MLAGRAPGADARGRGGARVRRRGDGAVPVDRRSERTRSSQSASSGYRATQADDRAFGVRADRRARARAGHRVVEHRASCSTLTTLEACLDGRLTVAEIAAAGARTDRAHSCDARIRSASSTDPARSSRTRSTRSTRSCAPPCSPVAASRSARAQIAQRLAISRGAVADPRQGGGDRGRGRPGAAPRRVADARAERGRPHRLVGLRTNATLAQRLVFAPGRRTPRASLAAVFPTADAAIIQARPRAALTPAQEAAVIAEVRSAVALPAFRLPADTPTPSPASRWSSTPSRSRVSGEIAAPARGGARRDGAGADGRVRRAVDVRPARGRGRDASRSPSGS